MTRVGEGILYRRATALRRALFCIYAGALAAGTHWPRLQIGDPEHPPDKLLHFIAFGGLAFFLWEARFFRRHRTLLLVALAWTALDEATQALPGLRRVASWEDVLAGSLGVLSATLFIWSMRPRGGSLSLLRRERFEGLLDSLLARHNSWLIIGTSGALGTMVGGTLALLLRRALEIDQAPFQTALAGGLIGAAILGGSVLLRGLRVEEERLLASGFCLGCGAIPSDEAAACPCCGRAPPPGRRLPWPLLGWPDVRRACLPPAVIGCGTLVLLFALWFSLVALRRGSQLAMQLDEAIRSLSAGMTTVLDLSLISIVAALAIDRARARLARRVDAGDVRCLGCGQDLRATPVVERIGRCGECGGAFLRAADHPSVPSAA